jgi:hypothetical protein
MINHAKAIARQIGATWDDDPGQTASVQKTWDTSPSTAVVTFYALSYPVQ